MVNSGDASQNNDPTGLILDPNPVASLAELFRESINRRPRMANVRELDCFRLDHAAIPHHLEVVQHRCPLVATRKIGMIMRTLTYYSCHYVNITRERGSFVFILAVRA